MDVCFGQLCANPHSAIRNSQSAILRPVDLTDLARRTIEVGTLKNGDQSMKYLLLIYDREQNWVKMSEAERRRFTS